MRRGHRHTKLDIWRGMTARGCPPTRPRAGISEALAHGSGVSASRLLGSDGQRLGRVIDLVVGLDAKESHPPLVGAKVRIGGRELFIPARQIVSLAPSAVRTSTNKLNLARFQRRPGEALLRGDLLGRDMIEITTARLVRAREIELVHERRAWRVAGIDTSIRARLRRLLPRWRHRVGKPVRFVGWSELEPFPAYIPSSRRRLARRLARLHPAQIADLVEAASHDQADEILSSVEESRDLEASVLEELDDEHRIRFLRDRSNTDVAALLARLPSDDAADLVMQVDQSRRRPVLDLLPAARSAQIRDLLRYNPETAGGIMNPGFVRVAMDGTVADAIAGVRAAGIPAQEVQAVYLSDAGGRFRGAVAVADLLRAEAQDALVALVRTRTPTVTTSADIPDIACVMSDYDLLSLAVVDDHARIVGVIVLDDVMERVLPDDWRRRRRLLSG